MTLGARGDNTGLREDLNHIRKGTPEKSEPEKAHEGLGQVTQTLENTDGGEIRPPPSSLLRQRNARMGGTSLRNGAGFCGEGYWLRIPVGGGSNRT
jgi:hypothetical protein